MEKVSEKPIIFSGPMIQQILVGNKTMTRRVVRDQESVEPLLDNPGQGNWVHKNTLHPCDYTCTREPFDLCPYGKPGERLWVREAHRIVAFELSIGLAKVQYPADDSIWSHMPNKLPVTVSDRLRPSIHMPYWASRITLNLTNIKVERIQDISNEAAKAEGMDASESVERNDGSPDYTVPFQNAWRLMHGVDNAQSWEANPWVWCISFRRLES